MRQEETCRCCNGAGTLICSRCLGKKFIKVCKPGFKAIVGFDIPETNTCNKCKGTGERKCIFCKGTGKEKLT